MPKPQAENYGYRKWGPVCSQQEQTVSRPFGDCCLLSDVAPGRRDGLESWEKTTQVHSRFLTWISLACCALSQEKKKTLQLTPQQGFSENDDDDDDSSETDSDEDDDDEEHGAPLEG